MMSLVHYGLRHSPPLAKPVRGRRGALVLAVRQKGSYSSCYQSTFTLPGYGLYAGEELQFIEDAAGRVVEALLGSMSFPRL